MSKGAGIVTRRRRACGPTGNPIATCSRLQPVHPRAPSHVSPPPPPDADASRSTHGNVTQPAKALDMLDRAALPGRAPRGFPTIRCGDHSNGDILPFKLRMSVAPCRSQRDHSTPFYALFRDEECRIRTDNSSQLRDQPTHGPQPRPEGAGKGFHPPSGEKPLQGTTNSS